MSFKAQKPKVELKDGNLLVTASAGVDSDNDGEFSAGVNVQVFVDSKEAVAEIIKSGVPEWLKNLIGAKEAEVQAAQAEQAQV